MMKPELNPTGRAAVEVVERLRKEGFQAYLVGGCVRDLVMGLEPKDYDVQPTPRRTGW